MEQSLWSANSSCPCSKEPRGRRELFFEAGSERTTSQVRPNLHSPTFRVLTSSVTFAISRRVHLAELADACSLRSNAASAGTLAVEGASPYAQEGEWGM